MTSEGAIWQCENRKGGALENIFTFCIYGHLFTALKANYNQERSGLRTRGAKYCTPPPNRARDFKYDF